MKRKNSILVILIILLIDQLSKCLIIKNLNVGNKIYIIKNFLKLNFVKNSGISFGFLSGNIIVIIVLSLLIIGFMIYELIKNTNTYYRLAFSFILGGAIGNLIDRVFRGYVIDFISFNFYNYEAAVFNFADMFITFGVIIYVYLLLKEGKNGKDSSK